ncbi:unnamed protein product [Peronospora belbahrii]|uniref:Apple domain-containing protein n=1 Tax=Peronospora belbahrii TaxID=622444 RepID=A0AAU9LJJ1_9STRA|nr:unnamed protein product [Peronospora belbahrii]CAH0516482.1 unnamed protein product [Peronospora belbahrii]
MFGGKSYLWACALVAFAASGRVVDAEMAHDVIVIGSGPGGLVAAEYLSRNSKISVLIIEAGPRSLAATGGTESPDYAVGSKFTAFDILGEYETIISDPKYAKFRTGWLPESTIGLGKLVGGSSSINAGLYFRVSDNYVNNSWPCSIESVNTKMDENEQIHGATDKPSTDGLWYLQEGYKIVAKAFLAQGYSEKTLNDVAARNSKSKTFGHPPFISNKGRRDSPANAFWGKMATRSNVKLVTDLEVDYILHTAGKATGVIYGGNLAKLTSRGTVVMAAGALGTPKVLIRSGIGSADQFNMLKGNSKFPGLAQGDLITNSFVGHNLFDANVVFASFSHPDMKSFRYVDRPTSAIDQYINKTGSGPWSSSGPVLVAYEDLMVEGRQYEFQTTIMPHGTGEFVTRNDAFTAQLFLNNPEARGVAGFNEEGVWRAFKNSNLYAGTMRDFGAMQQYVHRVVNAMTAQGATFLSGQSDDKGISEWVSINTGFIVHHFGGTCMASGDELAGSKRCADSKLRVLGTSNIFIADASAMRDGTVNPMGFIMYIGREAAEHISNYIATGGDVTKWDIQKPPQVCSAMEKDVDYIGNDIKSVNKGKAEDCCDVCQNTNGCKLYTWTTYNGGTCWLKREKGPSKALTGALSAQLL